MAKQEAMDLKISDCRIFQSFHDSGVIVMTTAYRFWIRSDVSRKTSPRKLAAIPGRLPSLSNRLNRFGRAARYLAYLANRL